MGHRKQKTRTITSFRVSTCCTAVHESLKNSNALQHNLVRGDIIDICDQADAAGVVFVSRVVKSLCVHIIPFLTFFVFPPLYAKNVPIMKNNLSIIEKLVKNVKVGVFRGVIKFA